MQKEYFDIIVVGAGHAGCEAALAAARLGLKTALFTITLDGVANMPCNPSIGGTAKGHLVREIDALGGEMGKAADKTFLQSRILNRGKGPAVHSLRAQIDRVEYHKLMKKTIEDTDGLYLKQAEITDIYLRRTAKLSVVCVQSLALSTIARLLSSQRELTLAALSMWVQYHIQAVLTQLCLHLALQSVLKRQE